MAVGQGVLAPVLDVAALNGLEGRLEVMAADRCAARAARLRVVLGLQAVFVAAGCRESTTAQLALLEQTSEHAAAGLVDQAVLLSSLPGGVEAVDCGLLSEAQAAAVTRRLLPAPQEVRLVVWQRLQARLLSAFEQGEVLVPVRLAELVGGWVIAADADAAAQRRRAASRGGGVAYKQREDGLVDITVFGVAGPDAQAVLSRIRDRARVWGAADDRTAEARRRDAAVNLWLGRDQQPPRDGQNPFDDDDTLGCGCDCAVVPGVAAGGGRCGCRSGELVPCGVGVLLVLPVGAALGTTDEVAVLQGHGPVEPDLAQAVLSNAPVIRPVWVDGHGVPVAVGDRTASPPRGDPAALREALLGLAAGNPPRLHPRHPDDHPGPTTAPQGRRAARGAGRDVPGPATPDVVAPWSEEKGGLPAEATPDAEVPSLEGCRTVRLGVWRRPVRLPQVLIRPHPVGGPGAYRPSTRLARLVRARSPRCEWPGCGQWAVRCDLDHDRAHPHGPTCACNLGPLCRHHHRLKQTVWGKAREDDGVRWTGPTGRTWLSPQQHDAPQPPTRPLPPLVADETDDLDDEDGSTDLAWLSGRADRLRADDPNDHSDEPDDGPDQLDRPHGWGSALDDPYRWGH